MQPVTIDFLKEQLEFGEELLAKRNGMFDPQDLPGRYGRAVKNINRVLRAIGCEAVVAGGWAVWKHGYFAHMTQNIDIVLPAEKLTSFLQAATMSEFESLPQPEGRWPKLRHKDTDVRVDILPEGARPGTAKRLAPTTIPAPKAMGANGPQLRYISLPALVELKLAAGRGRDEADVIELIRADAQQVATIREHLAGVHAAYVAEFERLVERAREQQDD